MLRLIFSILFCNLLLISIAQNAPLEGWKIHQPHSRAISVAESDNRIYCANLLGLHFYDKNDNSLNTLSKTNGLSDIGIQKIKYNSTVKTLLIAYENANIDLIKGTTIINIGDILRSNISNTKTINNIDFKDQYAYLSCNFGIVVLDMEREEIKETYLIGKEGNQIEVTDIALSEDTIFAATPNGIAYASLSNPLLNSYENWKNFDTLPSPQININTMVYFNNKLFINHHTEEFRNDTLFYYEQGQWHYFDTTSTADIYQLTSKHNALLIAADGFVDLYDTNLNLIRHIYNYFPGIANPREADLDKNTEIWIADNSFGLIHNFTDAFKYEKLTPSGPPTNKSRNLKFINNTLMAGTGGYTDTWSNTWSTDGFYTLRNQQWTRYNNEDYPIFDSIFDILNVTNAPNKTNHFYASSWGHGLIEYNNGEITAYNDSNSSLRSISSSDATTKIYDAVFDNSGNLWVTNSGVRDALHIKKADGSWQAFDLFRWTQQELISKLIIDNYNQKWAILPRGNGILVFNDNNSLLNTADDQAIRLTTAIGNGGLPSSDVHALAMDLDNHIWVGTDQGVAIFYNPGQIFNGTNFDAQQTIIQRDGYNQYLLEFETVTDIAVDGANRKWCATKNAGAFLISEDGTEELAHFTTENSPLISDNIYSIAINNQTGEVYFSTEKGIVSYKGTATEGVSKQQKITVFPNPVRPEYSGKIAIRGLAQNANIKITDISGQIVFETTAQGGQAIWEGTDFNGNRVQSGVYLIYSTSAKGEETGVTKILFIN